jgi:hypothetical protein
MKFERKSNGFEWERHSAEAPNARQFFGWTERSGAKFCEWRASLDGQERQS